MTTKPEELAEAFARNECGYYGVVVLKDAVDRKEISPGGDLSFYVGAKKGFLAGYEAGRLEGMQWMLKQLSREVEISPEVLDRVTSAYQGLLK